MPILVKGSGVRAIEARWRVRLFILACTGGRLCLTILLAQIVIFAREALSLLFQGLDIDIALLDLLLEAGNLAGLSGDGKLLTFLGLLVSALILLDLLFEAQHIQDHCVGSVQDQRQEQCEAAEIHVSLAVELAGLDFESLMAHHYGG